VSVTPWDRQEVELTDSLNNTYNILPSSSPLRPTVLLALISLLSLSGDLKTLSLTPLSLTISLSQWAISPQEKLEFLTSASAIYAGARESHRALELQIIAIEQLQAGKDAVEKAVVYALSDDKRFSVDDVLRVQGVKEKVEGKTAELVKLFEGDALEGVKKGQEWVGANSSWIEGFCESGGVRSVKMVADGSCPAVHG
jgi:translation initiation factor 3 subunit M